LGRWIILCIPLFLALLVIIPNANGEAYWGNLKVDIEKSDRISGEKTDVIRIRAEFTNNDREPITIYYSNIVLDDSKHREFSSSIYYQLRDKGHDVTERMCPLEFSIDINPGISEEGNFCFEVPKENVEFIFHIYEMYLDWCKDPPFGGCQEKTVKLNVAPPAPQREEPKTSPQPTPEYPTTSDPITTTSVIIPSGTGVPGCEENLSCFSPYSISVNTEETVTWSNIDSVAHTVTSGTSDDGPDGSFDSSLFMSGDSYSVKFSYEGTYDYFCMLHPWMTGIVIVDDSSSGGGIITFDTTPPVILSPSDIVVDAEDSSGAFVQFDVLAIDDVDQIVTPSCTPSSGSFFSIGDTKVICSAFDSAGNSASKKSFLVTVNAPSTSIPSWIKDVAAFWCDNKIDDASFVEGIQYLIDNGIIVISGTTTGTGSQEIPSWIKNNACWWSQGLISDADFAQGLQYLVKEGIIRV